MELFFLPGPLSLSLFLQAAGSFVLRWGEVRSAAERFPAVNRPIVEGEEDVGPLKAVNL